MLADPAADEIADRFDVLIQPVEIPGLCVFFRTAVARGNRVHEDQVADIEDALRIVRDARRWQGSDGAVARELDDFRPEHANVQPHCRGAGTAIERKHHRTVRKILGVRAHVADVKDRGTGLAVVRLEQQLARGDFIRNFDSLDGHHSLFDDGLDRLQDFDFLRRGIRCLFGLRSGGRR